MVTVMFALGGLIYRAQTVSVANPDAGVPYAPAFRGDRSGPGAVLNLHDGQAFGSLALDPLLSHPDEWGGGRAEMAYRASRPLFSWLVMLTSFGSADVAAWSLMVWTALGAGVLAAAAVLLADRWGRQTDWVPLLLLLPGVFGQMVYGGLSDGMATGLALLGVVAWLRGRDGWAIVALCLSALCRETALLAPLALLAGAAFSGRDWRRAGLLLVPFAVYVAWIGAVWLRLRALPTDAGQGRLSLPPANLAAVVGSWSWVEIIGALSIVVLAGIAWWRSPEPAVRWLVALSFLFGVTLGPAVLRSWDFTRALLPVTVVGACLLAARAHQTSDPPVAATENPVTEELSRR